MKWKSHQTLWPRGLYISWNSPGQNTGVGNLSLLQGIFPTQGSNPGLLLCSQILYQLSHEGSPRILEWVAYPFSSGSSRPGIEAGSPALQAVSVPAELSEEPLATRNTEGNSSGWSTPTPNSVNGNSVLSVTQTINLGSTHTFFFLPLSPCLKFISICYRPYLAIYPESHRNSFSSSHILPLSFAYSILPPCLLYCSDFRAFASLLFLPRSLFFHIREWLVPLLGLGLCPNVTSSEKPSLI